MENFSVKWDNFYEQRIAYMKPENNFTDVTIAGDDNQQIKAHRVILSAGSRFFRDLFIF